MDLRRLEVFAKVAELGSFSRAAEALFLTQPTISEHVRALEEEVGLSLLDRMGRGATPTPPGQLLLGFARPILRLQPEAKHAVAHVQGRMSGPLSVRERGSGSREAVERALADVGGDVAAFRVVGEMGSTQAVKQAVRAGVGVALISKRAVVDECLARLLHCVKVTDLKISRSFYLVTHRDRTRSPLAQAFVDFLESQAPALAS